MNISFVLLMYRQLTSQQRSHIDLSLAQQEIFTLLQRKTSRKEIFLIVEHSQSTIYREPERNSTAKGNHLWEKAHVKALKRRKRTTSNKKFDSMPVWHIKQMIIDHQWSPEQGVSISIHTVYNIINADESGELRRHHGHPDFRRRPKSERKPTKATNIPNRTSIHDRPAEADGKRFGDFEMDFYCRRLQTRHSCAA